MAKKVPKLCSILQDIIKKKHDSINLPLLNHPYFSYNRNLHSDIDCKISVRNNLIPENLPLQSEKFKLNKDTLAKTVKYLLKPTFEQSQIMIGYCDAYNIMYNNVVKLIKDKKNEYKIVHPEKDVKYSDLQYKTTMTDLRVHFLDLQNYLCKIYRISKHILDYAMQDCIKNFNTIVTKQLKGQIKHAKLRYLKKGKNKRIFKVDKHVSSKLSFFPSVMGEVLLSEPKLNYKKECTMVYIVQYNKKENCFLLLKRNPIKQISFKNVNNVIAIDPGQRTLVTGISENHILEIGTGISDKIKKSIDKINSIKKNKAKYVEKQLKNGDIIQNQIHTSKIVKQIAKIEDKINNYVTDVHWKVSKYLVLNYDHIAIGNLSTSNMKKKYKHDGNLQIMKCLNMFTFRERIKYRCLKYNKKYFRVNEAYTTKCCSNCATVNDIGQSKIYTCTNCNLSYDRDIKSAGCIYMKALM